MDNKEAINWLTRIRDRLMTTSSKQFEALTFAIAALEQQIPKRNLEKCQYNENLFTLRCPTCGALICNYNKRLDKFSYMVRENYCCICGQAIDFSEPQQEELDGD